MQSAGHATTELHSFYLIPIRNVWQLRWGIILSPGPAAAPPSLWFGGGSTISFHYYELRCRVWILSLRPFSLRRALFVHSRFVRWQHHRESYCLYPMHTHALTLTVFLVIIYKKSRALEHISNVTLPRESKKKARREERVFESAGACTCLDVRRL